MWLHFWWRGIFFHVCQCRCVYFDCTSVKCAWHMWKNTYYQYFPLLESRPYVPSQWVNTAKLTYLDFSTDRVVFFSAQDATVKGVPGGRDPRGRLKGRKGNGWVCTPNPLIPQTKQSFFLPWSARRKATSNSDGGELVYTAPWQLLSPYHHLGGWRMAGSGAQAFFCSANRQHHNTSGGPPTVREGLEGVWHHFAGGSITPKIVIRPLFIIGIRGPPQSDHWNPVTSLYYH